MTLSVPKLLSALWPVSGGAADPRGEALVRAWIQGKTRVPEITPGLLDRTSVWKQSWNNHNILWFNAPAGFGKTRAMAELAASVGERPLVWVSLEAGDTDSGRFLLSLLLSAEQCQPGIASATLNLFTVSESGAVLDLHQLLDHWLSHLANLEQAPVLMLSDVHCLASEDSWQLLMRLLCRCPAHVHLVLGSRYLPFSLGKSALLPRLQQLGTEALMLTANQQKQWLKQQGVLCDDASLRELFDRLKGWPASVGIWLACYRAMGSPVIAPGSLARREIADYWWTEVVGIDTDAPRELLAILAILGEAPEALLDHCYGAPSFAVLEQAVQRQLVVPLSLNGWYSLPQHFRSLARGILSLPVRQAHHRSACQWYCDRQQPVMAMAHSREAGESAELGDWVSRYSESILATLDTSGLMAWFESSGEDPLTGSPELAQLACWSYLLTHKVRRGAGLLRQLMQRDCLTEAEIAALQGYLARLRGQPKSALSQCQQAWEELPESRFSVRFLMATTLTYVCLGETDLNTARSWNRHALLLARQHKSLALESMALFDQARIELHRGHVDHSLYLVETGTALLSGLAAANRRLPMGRLLLYRAFLLWLTGREPEQLPLLLVRGIDLCRRSNDVLVCYGFGLSAMVSASQGQYRQALDTVDEAERLMQSWAVDPDRYRWMLLVKANIWMSEGKHHRAQGSLDELLQGLSITQLARPEVFPMLPDFTAATQARLYLVTRRFQECLNEVDEWLRCNSSPMIMMLIQLIRGAALRGCNQIAESQHIFSQVGQQLRHEGIEMSFNSWLPEIYATPGDREAPLKQGARVQLSEREHDVLRKIAEGLSNQEIATQLFISLHTVKSHARKINAKLGVKNRTQAIHKAKELLLL